MNDSKREREVIGKELTRLATIGASKRFNVDLSAIEKLSGEEVPIDVLLALATVGCETEEETNFVESVWSAIEANR